MASQRRLAERNCRVAMIVAGLGLSGCFDLVQTVGIDRQGAGRYLVSVDGRRHCRPGAQNEKLVNRQIHATLSTSTSMANHAHGHRRFQIAFRTCVFRRDMSLARHSRDFFGLGPSHVAFIADLMINKAKNENPQAASASGLGEKVAQGILGDHTYSFTVTYRAPLSVPSPS